MKYRLLEPDNFIPFVDTEIKIDAKGVSLLRVSRYYRQPHRKSIILHANSHNRNITKD